MALCVCSRISIRKLLELYVHWHKFAWKSCKYSQPLSGESRTLNLLQFRSCTQGVSCSCLWRQMEIIIPVHSIYVGMPFISLISESSGALSCVPAGYRTYGTKDDTGIGNSYSVTDILCNWFGVFFKCGMMTIEKVQLWGEAGSIVCELPSKTSILKLIEQLLS